MDKNKCHPGRESVASEEPGASVKFAKLITLALGPGCKARAPNAFAFGLAYLRDDTFVLALRDADAAHGEEFFAAGAAEVFGR